MASGQEFCDTKLSLGIGIGDSEPKSQPGGRDKRPLDLDLSFNDEPGQTSSENPGELKKKLRLLPEQTAVLEGSFKETPNPKTTEKNELAAKLGLNPRQVEVWFQNRRARTKSRKTQNECQLWKQKYEAVVEENQQLKKENEKMKALIEGSDKAVVSAYLAGSVAISVCPTCHKVEEVRKEKNVATTSNIIAVQKPKTKKKSGVLKIRG